MAKIKTRYPIRKLSILNLWITSFFFMFGLFSSLASYGYKDLHLAIRDSLLGGIMVNLNTFINLGLLLKYEKRFSAKRKKQKLAFAAFSYLVNLPIYIIVIMSYDLALHIYTSPYSILFISAISVFVNTLILAFQNFVIVQDEKVIAELENSKLRAANANAANQLLRQQIHPHFLFNALNILKSLYKRNPEKGEEYLIHLSDFLRASVSSQSSKVISLLEEIKLCTDYLEMQKIRFGNALNYTISISNEMMSNGSVPSFSIQPLLENAIKHNELTEDQPLEIDIRQEKDRVRVINNRNPKKVSIPSTGHGLLNISERYKILSKDDIIIDEKEDKFSVSIKVYDYEYSNN